MESNTKIIIKRVRSTLPPLVPSFIAGVVVAQLLLLIGGHTHHMASATILAIVGDSLGFYSAEFIRKMHELRRTTTGWARVKQAAIWLVSEYAIAEIVDVAFMRGWTVGAMNWLIDNGNIASFLGNLEADVFFVGIVVITGTEFSIFVIRFLKRLSVALSSE